MSKVKLKCIVKRSVIKCMDYWDIAIFQKLQQGKKKRSVTFFTLGTNKW